MRRQPGGPHRKFIERQAERNGWTGGMADPDDIRTVDTPSRPGDYLGNRTGFATNKDGNVESTEQIAKKNPWPGFRRNRTY